MSNKLVFIPHLGRTVCLVNRNQLRFGLHGRRFETPRHLARLMANLPSPPATFSWSKGGRLSYPILGNDQYGDCYYAAVCHAAQTYTGNAGTECSFSQAQVVTRYLQIAGGDNGLDDATIMPEWKAGICGPNGPHKILDEMTVNPQDDASTALAMWAFCGLIYTAGLPDVWVKNPQPGSIWDAAPPDQSNGHAMLLTGKDPRGYYEDQTWGFNPPVWLTPAGLKGSDPELIVAFSLDMFNAQGIAPNLMSYDDLANLWKACGGRPLPPNPFVNPPTPPTPAPPGPNPPGPTPPTPTPGATSVLMLTGNPLLPGTYVITHR